MIYSIKKHRMALQLRSIPPVERWDRKDDHPYRSNGQPVLAWLALIGCLFLLLIAGGSNLWDGFHAEPFLSAYLFVSAQRQSMESKSPLLMEPFLSQI